MIQFDGVSGDTSEFESIDYVHPRIVSTLESELAAAKEARAAAEGATDTICAKLAELESAIERAWCNAADWLERRLHGSAELKEGVTELRNEARRRAGKKEGGAR
jgi:hypothetical protein